MTNFYNGLSPEKAFLEYSLEILNYGLIENDYDKVQDNFNKLEEMLKKEKSDKKYLLKTKIANIIFNVIRYDNPDSTSPITEDTKTYKIMRDVLLNAQMEFEKEYRK